MTDWRSCLHNPSKGALREGAVVLFSPGMNNTTADSRNSVVDALCRPGHLATARRPQSNPGGISGEILHVDGGFHAVGVPSNLDAGASLT